MVDFEEGGNEKFPWNITIDKRLLSNLNITLLTLHCFSRTAVEKKSREVQIITFAKLIVAPRIAPYNSMYLRSYRDIEISMGLCLSFQKFGPKFQKNEWKVVGR